MLSTAPDSCGSLVTSVAVAVAVIENAAGDILLSQRPRHVHLGGCWEFPGGKIELGETVLAALAREVHEELGLRVLHAEPMLQIPWVYPEKSVRLHVWRVTAFDGVPAGQEQQRIQWVPRAQVQHYPLPPANKAILTALQLPDTMLIAGPFVTVAECLGKIQYAVEEKGIRCVQLRAPWLSASDFDVLARAVAHYCHQKSICLLLNTSSETSLVALEGVSGVHLNAQRLMLCRQRPVPASCLLGASCHDEVELRHAWSLPVDYVTLSPVLPTASHPGATSLGWTAFGVLASLSPVPVLALGGVTPADQNTVLQAGAYGIAGISAWW